MTHERHPGMVYPLPYEPLTEELAKEQMEHIYRKYGTDPDEIIAHLPVILHEFAHDVLTMGIDLADVFPHLGVADMIEAFSAGIEQGRIERGE